VALSTPAAPRAAPVSPFSRGLLLQPHQAPPLNDQADDTSQPSANRRRKLTRAHRLQSIDVKRVLEAGRRFSLRAGKPGDSSVEPPMMVSARSVRRVSVEGEGDGHARIAVAVPKRLLKRSVDRNRVKRWMREAFRQHEARERVGDVLLTLSSKPTLREPKTRAEIRRQLNALIAQIGAQNRSKSSNTA
jgi:RNase P protein component